MKRWYLFPLSLLYGLGTGIRNALYNVGLRRTTKFRTPIICVGNLSVGGTGKSPLVMHLAALLSKNYRTTVLSRGYGRNSKGYQVVNYSSTARTVGDEAMQLFMRFKNRIVIAVCEDRVSGARKLISDMEPGVILLMMPCSTAPYNHRSPSSPHPTRTRIIKIISCPQATYGRAAAVPPEQILSW